MPTAWMPESRSASPPICGSAKKPSVACERRDGRCRQHSRLPKTTSASCNAATTCRNGTVASATFMRLTSPVRISLPAIVWCLARLFLTGRRRLQEALRRGTDCYLQLPLIPKGLGAQRGRQRRGFDPCTRRRNGARQALGYEGQLQITISPATLCLLQSSSPCKK